ncbi:MAG: hypothetical protein LYZ69_07600 [Nitrososphaerales archaeon]|nr:hypothetical protein [Nitrososphaerales archaeon]
MTYDIHCYKPISDSPSVEEARRVLEAGYEFPELDRAPDPEDKWKIAAALMRFDSKLEPFKLDPVKLANMTIDQQERMRTDSIELNTPRDGRSIQISIFEDSVGVLVPYWYEGAEIDEVFA